ncbi:MAG: hypothetical protein KJO07_03670, partial [Deltaproteobacteria bacterium]|nr:hypothetical protein [Deltaproteobacteria bacterium]
CWGYGLRGQLGDGVLMSSEDPVPVSGSAATAEQIALGDVFGCALSSGAVNCWGDDGSSQLGDSSSGTSRAVPGPVLSSGDPLTGVTDLFAGGTQGCGLLADGSASCWGAIAYGPEGSSAFTYPTAPTPIVAMELHRARSFALTSVMDQELYCAGYNGDGECMIAGSTTSTVGSVTQGDLGIGATAVTAGLDHTCVLIADVVQCVGQNDYGQLGDDVSAPTAGGAPIAVTLPATPVQIAAGDEHNCARLSTGEVYCWGRNSYGQLGDGTTQSTSTTGAPVKVTLPTDDAKAVVAQRQKSCAILGDDTIWCWGDNEDDLFRNPAVEDITRTPVQVLDTAVTQVDVGNDHMCAIYLADSSVHCWGRNDRGQLGDGRATNTLSPSPTVLTCEDE